MTNYFINNSKIGVYIVRTDKVTAYKNNFSNDIIVIEGRNTNYWNTHTISNTNLVNGRPIYYWKNKNSGTISIQTGQIILASCTNVLIKKEASSKESYVPVSSQA